jgi:hypothetical protein
LEHFDIKRSVDEHYQDIEDDLIEQKLIDDYYDQFLPNWDDYYEPMEELKYESYEHWEEDYSSVDFDYDPFF